MSSPIMIKLSGNITVEGTSNMPLPFGVSIEFTAVQSSSTPGGWIGNTPVYPQTNTFDLKTPYPVSAQENVKYFIYKDQHLVQEGTTLFQNFNTTIEIEAQNIDKIWYSNDMDTVTIKGNIDLGPAQIHASPEFTNLTKAYLYKGLFRQEELLGTSVISDLGTYCFTIPKQKLLNSDTVINECSNSEEHWADVYVVIKNENEVLEKSELTPVNSCKTEINLSISQENHYSFFKTEFTNLKDVVTKFTNLSEAQIHTITTEGENSELIVIAKGTGHDKNNLMYLIESFKQQHELMVNAADSFSLYKSVGAGIKEWINLDDQAIFQTIQSASDQYIIPVSVTQQQTLEIIRNQNTIIVSGFVTDDGADLNTVLNSILQNPQEVTQYINIMLNANPDQSVEQLWNEVELKMGVVKKQLLQKGHQVLAVSGMQPEMTQDLLAEIQQEAVDKIALKSVQEWYDTVSATCNKYSKLCVPLSIRGEVSEQDYQNTQVKQSYAQQLYQLSNEIFSKSVFQHRLNTDQQLASKFSNPQAIQQFLNNNADYDFRVQNVWELGLQDENLKNDLISVQNLTRLANGQNDIIVPLIKENIKGSTQVAALSFGQFESIFEQSNPGKIYLKDIHIKAKDTSFLVQQTYIQLLPGSYVDPITQSWSKDIWSVSKQAPDPSFPDLESLFGNMDFCSCTDCSSMYSPSSYFTDVLNFIRLRLGTTAGYTELLRRRSDLPHINLSCKNANTEMPYIDLVIEQLELMILRDIKNNENPSLFIPDSFQTSATSQQLNAYPEHVYKDVDKTYKNYRDYTLVYDTRLNKAIYPNTLPYNLAQQESEIFTRQLGYSRQQLMQYYPLSGSAADEVNQYNTAIEAVGLDRLSADIITKTSNADLPTELWKYYGFNASGTWYTDLCNDLNMLLFRANITYIQLLEILNTDYLNPIIEGLEIRTFAIVAKPDMPVDTCNIDELMIECRIPAPDTGDAILRWLDQLHRFIRIVKATKWTVYQLDIVLASFQTTEIEEETLYNISQLFQLSNAYKKKPEILVVLWSDINTRHYINYKNEAQDEMPSVYDTLFRNKDLINPPDLNFEHPEAIIGTLEDNMATIIAAFRIKEEDLLAIHNDLDIPTTLSSLSMILKCITGAELLLNDSYSYFSMVYAFKHIEIYNTPQEWINEIIWFRHNQYPKLSQQDIEYLYLHKDETNLYITSDSSVQLFYENLRISLRKKLNNNVLSDATSEMELLKAQLVQFATQEIASSFNLDFTTIQYFYSNNFKIGVADDTVLNTIVSDEFINSTEAITPDNTITGFLDFSQLYHVFQLLTKVSLLLTRFKLSDEVFCFICEHHLELTTLNIFDMPTLPDPSQIKVANVSNGLFHMIQWVKLRDQLELSNTDLQQFIQLSIAVTDNNSALCTYLNNRLSWSFSDLQFLIGDADMDLGVLEMPVTDYRIALSYLNLDNIMLSSYKIGLSAKTIYQTLVPGITTYHSHLMRKTAKAKYDEEQWQKVVKPLQDQLRKQQRNALTDYIIASPEIVPDNSLIWKNKNDLYAYLLIDVEMESCMKTSRLKLAISTLQLYVERIILNLEVINGTTTKITIEEEPLAQWQSWRKWYRIWEANRKVFLYPENWIEPELRDNKSPLFKDLEDFLLQDEMTERRVEDGFINYLHGLNDVARLEPVSAYHQISNTKDIVHVFGRTDTEPQHYYYRALENNEWSAWEKINLDIKSDHVVPVMWNDRLFLFWLTASYKASGYDRTTFASDSNRNWEQIVMTNSQGFKKYNESMASPSLRSNVVQLYLTWSEMKDGKWQKQEKAKETMDMDISYLQINKAAQLSYSIEESGLAFDLLTQRGVVKPEEFFKNRLYLLTPYLNQVDKNEIIFNILMPGGWNENGQGVYSYIWSGDTGRNPRLVKNIEYSFKLLAPSGTRFNKMKFEQDPELGCQLKKDTTFDKDSTGYYTYSQNFFITHGISWYRSGEPQTILKKSPYDQFRLTAPAADDNFIETAFSPIEKRFFYEDKINTFYVEKVKLATVVQAMAMDMSVPSKISLGSVTEFVDSSYELSSALMDKVPSKPTISAAGIANVFNPNGYLFHTFYHAQIDQLVAAIHKGGIPELLKLANQQKPDTMGFAFNYQPTSIVNSKYPTNKMQFGFSEPYSIYNWELFFHAPLMIAQGLSNNQKFEAAQQWYHYIFNPMTTDTGAYTTDVQRYWKFQPFYEISGSPMQTLTELLIAIHNNNTQAVLQVRKWENNPFNPHLIARMRILAYMKNVLMKYLDNLIAWGDNLFRRDTMESINEATQLYILASNILGERPKEIPPRIRRADYTFDELLEFGLDSLSNAMVTIESFYAPNDIPSSETWYDTDDTTSPEEEDKDSVMALQTLYFCLPKNDKLLAYWDVIADRLFKIRNCMNIDGIVRQLSLYESPIDPGLLVRAQAMGLDMNTVLDQIYGSGLPYYRFSYVLQKAGEFINDVKALGGAILAAIEKKDAETLSLLRSTHEINMLEKIKGIKEQQVNEAIENLEGLKISKENAIVRHQYYTSRKEINDYENKSLLSAQDAIDYQEIQMSIQNFASIMALIPQFSVKLFAAVGPTFGGLNLSSMLQATAANIGLLAAISNYNSSKAATLGGYERRMDDWKMQAQTAALEIEQFDRQILAAEIRLDIAQRELENQELQIENTLEVHDYMRTKFSNADLYSWMSSQIATTYFQSYQLAFDMAKKADTCFQNELPGRNYPADGFIKFGYWDSLKKGLMSGEKLQLDLRRMDAAYMDENKRELELTKQISLGMFNPEALLALKSIGNCEVSLPEALFDLDYPGHYMRRIKSISLSIPCVAGPYTTISCQLTQVRSEVRKNAMVSRDVNNPDDPGNYNDPVHFNAIHSNSIIATSSAQNDSGLFEVNFRDERYLPFEGTGAISTWNISFPESYRQFDFNTISDVIMQVQYTARFDGSLAIASNANLKQIFAGTIGNILHRIYSLKHEFSNEWYRYQIALENEEENPTLDITIKREQYPFFTQDKEMTIKKMHFELVGKSAEVEAQLTTGSPTNLNLILKDQQLISQAVTVEMNEAGLTLKMSLSINAGYSFSDIEDLYLITDYIIQ